MYCILAVHLVCCLFFLKIVKFLKIVHTVTAPMSFSWTIYLQCHTGVIMLHFTPGFSGFAFYNCTVEPYNGPDTFCCNIEFPLSEAKKMIADTCWNQNFSPYYGGFFYCILNSEGLLREVPLYFVSVCFKESSTACIYKIITRNYLAQL